MKLSIKWLSVAMATMLSTQAGAFGLDFGGGSTSLFGGGSQNNNNSIDVGGVMDALRAGKSLIKGFEDLTPEQEYYLGRATTATLLGRYKPKNIRRTHEYLNGLVQYLALFSDRPETFKGYRVQVIEDKQGRAYSAPGGFIVISSGMLQLCQTEDELAAVLAHEIGHISHKHGLSAIKTSHLAEAGQILGGIALKYKGNYQQASGMLKSAFGASVDDIVVQLVESGYSQSQETAADQQAALILARAGYHPQAVTAFLEKAAKHQTPAQSRDPFAGLTEAFNQTHPGGKERIQDVRDLISGWSLPAAQPSGKRQKRFNSYLR